MYLVFVKKIKIYIIFLGSGGRRRILDNGNLVIYPVGRDDEGLYVCIAENVHGIEESHGRLIVMRKFTLY